MTPLLLPWLTLAPALAGPPPDGLDLVDPTPWAEKAEVFDAGPDGCWQLDGKVRVRLFHDAGASLFGRATRRDETVEGTVEGIFHDHEWTRFHYRLDRKKEPWMIVFPAWGEVVEGAIQVVDDQGEPIPDDPDTVAQRERAQGAQERREARRGGGDGEDDEDGQQVRTTSIEYLEWDAERDALVLVEDAALTGIIKGEASRSYLFPNAEEATEMDITLPASVKIGTWPLQGTIREGSLHTRGYPVGGSVLPHAQRLSAIATGFGQTLGIDVSVSYTGAATCTPEAAAVRPAEDAPEGPAQGAPQTEVAPEE